MIKNVDPKKSYEHIKKVIANDDFIFFTANDSIHGEELWRSGGTESSTYLLKDINVGINSAWNDFQGRAFIKLGNKIYFNANDGVNGDELWV
ncbi:MAG: hyalin, partial [Bacteroidota bacterium]